MWIFSSVNVSSLIEPILDRTSGLKDMLVASVIKVIDGTPIEEAFEQEEPTDDYGPTGTATGATGSDSGPTGSSSTGSTGGGPTGTSSTGSTGSSTGATGTSESATGSSTGATGN